MRALKTLLKPEIIIGGLVNELRVTLYEPANDCRIMNFCALELGYPRRVCWPDRDQCCFALGLKLTKMTYIIVTEVGSAAKLRESPPMHADRM